MAVPVTDMIVSTAEDGVVAETTSIKDPNLAMAQSDVNNVLLEIISRFSGATYAGVATPETDPGTPLLKVFYLTTTAGEYANFGNLTVESGKLTVLLYNGSTWEKQALDLPASGGSTVNIVQTTGASTTDVMSQKVVTDELTKRQLAPATVGEVGQVLTQIGPNAEDVGWVSPASVGVSGGVTSNAAMNSVIRKLYIDTSGYTGSNSLDGLYISILAKKSSGTTSGIRINNQEGVQIADFWVQDGQDLDVIEMFRSGIYCYAEYAWGAMSGEAISGTAENSKINDDGFLSINDPRRKSKNKLSRKILCCVGDSITEGADMDAAGQTNYPSIEAYKWNTSTKKWGRQEYGLLMTYGYQIAARHNMIFYNGGVSGSTMEAVSGKNGFSVINGRYTLLPDNIDYLTIFFGWNDAFYGTLGTIDDSENTSFYGGYNVVLPYLINKYPHAKIALIVPFGTTSSHRQAVRELGNKWGVGVFDMFQGGTPLYYNKESDIVVEESIVTSNREKFQANGAHPNFLGHKQIGDMLESFLFSL